MKVFYISVLIILSALTVSAQTSYEEVIGGAANEKAFYSIQNSTGNLVVLSTTTSYGAGSSDILLNEITPTGTVILSKTYGGSGTETPRCIEQTSDGGYILTGYTSSFGAIGYDIYVIKITSSGVVTWSSRYGGSSDDYGTYIHAVSGGYVLVGYSYSWGAGESDAVLIQLNSTGGVISGKAYGNPNEDFAISCAPDSYGGYLLAGAQEYTGAGLYDHWYLHIATNGSVDYSINAGRGDNEAIASVVQSRSNGDFILAGHIRQFGAGGVDMSVVRLSRQGTVLWSKAFGGSGDEAAYCITEDASENLTFTGNTNSFGSGGYDAFTIHTNSSGTVIWNSKYGGGSTEAGNWLVSDLNGHKITGSTTSHGSGEQTYVYTLNTSGNSANACHANITSSNYSPTINTLTSSVTTTILSVSAVNTATTTTSPSTPATAVQSTCATVIVQPPIGPMLSIDGCNGDLTVFENVLNWSSISGATSYNIYYAEHYDDPLKLLATSTTSPFIDTDLISLAGCYQVSAVTSAGESTLSNKVCVDNCVYYELPNLITPPQSASAASDSLNDLFRPLLGYRGVEHVHLYVYNRWGKLVHEQEGDPVLKWNSKSSGLSDGIYFISANITYAHRLHEEDEQSELKGWLQIISE